MTHRCRFAFSRLARGAAAFATVATLVAGGLAAQETSGKIEGTVKDQSGAVISGAQVLIVGTAFSASTNEQGYYFINNVPAGVMTVRAQYIGYAPAEVRGVRVLAGQTMTVNLRLEQRAVEVTGITVTTQANPIVPRDQVTSKPIIQGDVIEHLPVNNVNEVLRLQPGVVESNRGLSVRGGRIGEAALYLDGALVRNMSSQFGASNAAGNPATPVRGTSTVGTNALEQASVTTGAIGAEFGEAQSGVISLVTRSGGPDFRGSLSYSTDDVSGETYGQGLNRVEGSIGGPLARNLTFFLAATVQGQQNARQGKGAENVPIYVLSGVDQLVTVPRTPGSATSDSQVVALPSFTRYSQGSRRPDDNSDVYTLDGKLRYSFGGGSSLSATFHRTRNQSLSFRGGNLYDPAAQRGSQQLSHAFIVNWTQNLGRSSERALSLDANFSWQRDQTLVGLLDPSWFGDHHNPSGWFNLSDEQFVTNFDNFPIDDRLIQNLRVNNCLSGRDAARPAVGGCVPYINRNDLDVGAAFRGNPYGVSAGRSYLPISGINSGGPTLQRETRYTGRANLDWQANRYNRVKLGGDFVRADMTNFQSAMIDQGFMNATIEHPLRYGLYATDRIDLGDVVVDVGLRYDRLDSKIKYPRTPGRIFSDPLRVGKQSDTTTALKNSALTASDSATVRTCAANLAAADTLSYSTCNFFAADPRGRLSPSLRVSFPVTDRTGFRLSYAHQVQSPDFGLLATCANCDLSFTNTNSIFSRDLDFGRSILFEFGARHAFSDDMVLDISAYNKDKVSDITGRILEVFDRARNTTQNLNLMTNQDFGNVRGVDVKLDRRIGSLFQGTVSYTFQNARSTGSDPFEYLNTLSRQISSVTGDRAPPPQALLTTRENRTHTIAGNLALNFPHGWHSGSVEGAFLQDVGMFATFRFASGLAFTRLLNAGAGTRGPGNGFGLVATGTETLNSSTMPWIKNVDLRVTRGFRFGSRDISVFADFRNLFNFTNLANIYAETGDVVNDVHRQGTIDPVKTTLTQEAGTLVQTRLVNGVSLSGVDLSDCTKYNTSSSFGRVNCLMLQRAEARFGNGDGFFDSTEQDAAYTAWYNLFNGPQTLRDPGFNVRIGFQLNF